MTPRSNWAGTVGHSERTEGGRRTAFRWWLVPAVLAAACLQTALAPRLAIRDVRPDWALMFVVVAGLGLPRSRAVVASWCLGFLLELLSLERLGIVSLPYCIVGWCVAASRHRISAAGIFTPPLLVFVSGVFVFTFWFLYGAWALPEFTAFASFGKEVFARAALTAAWTLGLYAAVRTAVGLWNFRPRVFNNS